ncbi:hypothetical protein GWI33_016067 [Rhynchophorus ferrugineus]|uniref:Beta-glucuronidase n=1 Tax=Rhynchophorus ferrugineus TaxID=354439 RepID=A0A834HY05_RHYFE|nr:hypothetical protein GWI33_016067 [Rhynchophorus ferrugineus]
MNELTLLCLFALLACAKTDGILPAQASVTRNVASLDGLWYFTTNSDYLNNIESADDLDINLMPVPSSYNDISPNVSLRDHVGPVWYQRKFYVPASWQGKKIWIRFGSVCYSAKVSINGEQVASHEIGHLPFVAEISSQVNFIDENVILVEVNNILTSTTVPQGEVETLISGRIKQTYTFDFFNYAGIDRPVVLYTTPETYIDDIKINTKVQNGSGYVTYNLTIANSEPSISLKVLILDKSGNIVLETENAADTVEIENATFWWPYLMDPNPGYMYKLKVQLIKNNELIDTYTQPFGIRELTFDDDTFKINGESVYLRGFGRHEDSDIRGKGLDLPLIIRDYNLIKWIGANCYRTSHYPYAEEIMDLADELGIMIIDEVPAVNTDSYSDELLENHMKSLTELYHRDKNRPSVVIWSIANEPNTEVSTSEDYYSRVAAHIKSLDRTRPITLANFYDFDADHTGQFLDIIGLNRYQAWYNNVGEIDGIYTRILAEIVGWRLKYNKPVLMTEYGADSVEGLSILPSFIWSEEYQNDLMAEYFKSFDELRTKSWFIGEMIWNFADFKTDQDIRRVGGNRKGVFTRNRQPKTAAFYLRKRYWALANQLNNVTLPTDLDRYVIKDSDSLSAQIHTEL